MTKVFLSAGHGGYDPGAVAYGMKEKDGNLNTLLACKEVLENHGITVVCSRTKDEDDPVQDEVKEANACGADIAVSFHENAGGGDGFEAYYYTTSSKGKKLAQLGEKYVKQLGQNSRGIKSGNHLMFVRATNMPAVLFESFFLDNDTDNDIGDTKAEQRAFGVAYAKAILEYFGISYKGTSASKPSSSTSSSKSSSSGFDGGKYRCTVSKLNVRDKPSMSGKVVASYSKGQTVVLDSWYTIADGYVWGRYTGSSSGKKRYVAVGKPTGAPAADDYLIKC